MPHFIQVGDQLINLDRVNEVVRIEEDDTVVVRYGGPEGDSETQLYGEDADALWNYLIEQCEYVV